MKTAILIIGILIKIQFVDKNTGEILTGVKVETENGVVYSDIDGYVSVPKGEKIKTSYISYKDTALTADSEVVGLNMYK